MQRRERGHGELDSTGGSNAPKRLRDVRRRVLLPAGLLCLLHLAVLLVYCEATFAMVLSSHVHLPYGVFSVVAVGFVCWGGGWLLLARRVRAIGCPPGANPLTPMRLATRAGVLSVFCCLANAGIRIAATWTLPVLDGSDCIGMLSLLAGVSLLGLILAGLSVFVPNLRQQGNFYVLWLFAVAAMLVMSAYNCHVLLLLMAGV